MPLHAITLIDPSLKIPRLNHLEGCLHIFDHMVGVRVVCPKHLAMYVPSDMESQGSLGVIVIGHLS